MKKKIKITDMPAGKKAKSVKGGLTLLAQKDNSFQTNRIKTTDLLGDNTSPIFKF